MQRIHVLNVSLRQRLNHSAGIKLKKSLPERIRGYGAHLRHPARILPLLVIKEIEQAVRYDFATDGCAELVSHQRLSSHARLIVEPGVGGESGVAIVFIERTMHLVRPALGHQRHLSAGGASEIWSFSGDGHTEFLHRIQWNREHAVKTGVRVYAVAV